MENTDQILDAPQVETVRLQYAGFWIRTVAYILDSLILAAIGFVMGLALAEVVPEAAVSVLNLIVGICYFAFMEASESQATLGKMAVGIKVGDLDGDQLSLGNAMGRYLGKILSAIVLCIGFMMVGWDEKKQGLHDRLADTYVFYK